MDNKSTYDGKVFLISTHCSQVADKHVLFWKNFAASFPSYFPVETGDVFSHHLRKLW